MAAISLLLTVISLFTFWLVIPMLVLPPLAFFLGLKSYRTEKARKLSATSLSKLVSLFPMVAAAVAFIFEFYVMNTQYRP
jgi:hypothetical protein